jgi:hypothetical protein
LFNRTVHRIPHYFGGKPIRRVILAKAVSFRSVDEGFVENFQHIAFHFIETEASDVSEDTSNQVLAFGVSNHPIEEVAFGCTEYANAPRMPSRTRRALDYRL